MHGVSQNSTIIGESMGYFLHAGPLGRLHLGIENFAHGGLAHLSHKFVRDKYRFGHEDFDGIAWLSSRYGPVKLLHVIDRKRRTAIINNKWWLVHRQLFNFSWQ